VSGRTLAIARVANSDLKIDGTATAAAISITSANQTLEIGASPASLTLTSAQAVRLGKIQRDGGTLTGTSGITLGSGTNNGFITGFGKVAAAVSHGGTGTGSSVTATGGTLEVTGVVTGVNTLAIGGGASDKLLLDGASSATSVTFAGSTGTLEINTAGETVTVTNAMTVGANTVKLDTDLITKGAPPALPGWQQKFDSSCNHPPGSHRRNFEHEPPSTRTKFRRWTGVRAPEQTNDRRRTPRGTNPEKNPEPALRHAPMRTSLGSTAAFRRLTYRGRAATPMPLRAAPNLKPRLCRGIFTLETPFERLQGRGVQVVVRRAQTGVRLPT